MKNVKAKKKNAAKRKVSKKKTPKRKVARKKAKRKPPARKTELTFAEYMDMSRAELEGRLSFKERRFCLLYTSDREFFANGTASYAAAYGFDLTKKGAYDVCGVSAFDTLKKPKIKAYQSKLLDASGLSDIFVDKELVKLITQDMDFGAKIRAINEYNRLKGRHTKNLNLNVKGRIQVEPVMFGKPIKE